MMTWCVDVARGPHYQPTIHLSNMPQVSMPSQQLQLVIQVVESLKSRWLEVCQYGQDHLHDWVSLLVNISHREVQL